MFFKPENQFIKPAQRDAIKETSAFSALRFPRKAIFSFI
ncbi:hypothetical protein WCP94_002970 [Bilophila wadsworthia]